ncbi:MAG: hypothetical protein JO035_17500 [Betaproteobacteria bacterium]|nr:hypothetical protein [Betaproteobacteria bacterium]
MARPVPVEKRVSVCDASELPWANAGKAGLALKTVREDREKGRFLGLVGFEALTRSGLHQHLGVATSFVLDGGLTDYWGSVTLHEAGINLKGATHDAIAYQKTLLVSRLEAPVVYPPETGRDYALHTGPRFGEIRNEHPELPPDINIAVDRLVAAPTHVAGVTRKMIFDYALSAGEHRYAQIAMLPRSAVPAFRTRAPLELWLRAGDLRAGGQPAHANCFVIVEAGATLALSSEFGALFHAWSEAPIEWLDEPRPDLFGF